MKRQAIRTSIKNLKQIIKDLEKQSESTVKILGKDNYDIENQTWILSIINKTGMSDDWFFEHYAKGEKDE